MRLVATFTAAFGSRIRNSEVHSTGDGLGYTVHVGDETSHLMAKVAETPSLTTALRAARGWMDSINLQEAASAQQGGDEGGEHPAEQAGSDQVDAGGGNAERGEAE